MICYCFEIKFEFLATGLVTQNWVYKVDSKSWIEYFALLHIRIVFYRSKVYNVVDQA